MQQWRGTARGGAEYQTVIDAGKAVAPIAAPLVQDYLAEKGLPTTPQAALGALVNAATSTIPLDTMTGLALHGYLAQAISAPQPLPAGTIHVP